MKNLNSKKQYTLFICIIISFFFSINSLYAQDLDTLEWEEIVDLADTVYNNGLDTIYELEDSVYEESTFRTGASLDCSLFGTAMSINLNKTIEPINKGLYGVNVTGMFTQNTLYGDIYSTDQWQWLSNMRPKVLRFPGGSSSKFMHLLPYKDGPDAGTDFDPIKGYGYDIVEITRYLDAIDNVLEAPDNATDILAASETEMLAWFGGEEEIKKTFIDEYVVPYTYQEQLISGDMFIDHFIALVNQIEADNPGHTVDVLVCLNILTETAEQCMAIVEYLEANGVNVAGVEMGNETPNKFHKQIMQFDEFNDYWNYLDGATVAGQVTKETALGESLYIPAANRNFFLVFKNKAGSNYKIGLCADGIDDTTNYHVFSILPSESAGFRIEDWNTALQSHYGDTHTGGNVKKFHAVIIHTYNSAESWYDECIVETGTANSFSCPEWDFDNADTRLDPAFIAVRSNFRSFIKTHFWNDLDYLNTYLQFNLTSTNKKDMWITEWNLKDEGTPNNGKLFSNSYMHTTVFQEWWMNNMKLNFTSGFRKNFIKYATVQNYAGGSGIQLLTNADEEVELEIIGEDVSPYNLEEGDPLKRNYYIKRTTAYTMDLLSEINKNILNYFPATTATYAHNPNLPPTFFIDPAKEYVYMYYTNTRCNEQRYILNPGGMTPMYGYVVELEDAAIYAVDAFQAYSQSGKSMLYDINSCYDPDINPYDIEIDQAYTYTAVTCTADAGSLCFSAPGYTSGYVKMHIVPYVEKLAEEKVKEVKVYPNPANNILNISANEEIQSVQILSLYGATVLTMTGNTQSIDITALPYGMYQIVCIFNAGTRIFSSFVKA
ncbi:MAG: T9SS type A sorting domain-containing protein [Chitinophagales bacterium]